MNRYDQLLEERKSLLEQQQNIITNVKAEGRERPTQDEMRNLEWKDDRRRKIDAEIESFKADAELLKRLDSYGHDPDYTGRDGTGLHGFNMDEIKTGLSTALRRKGAYGFDMPFTKAAVTAGDQDLPSVRGGEFDAPPGDSVVALRELFTEQQTDGGPNVRYYKIGLGSGADVVAEGGEKPELTAGITPVDAALQKIAVRFTYTDELAEDAQFLVSYVAREATRAVLRRENTLITATLDAETGALTETGAAADVIDVLAAAIGEAQATNGLTPTRIVANPADVAAIRTLKSSGSGEYAIDPLSGQTTSVHGVPLVSTPAVAAGTMYLTSSGLGVFYTRGPLRVEAGFADGDWEHNRVSTRVEERVLPALVRPSLLTQITLTSE